ncbi:MAG: phage tail sheath family protein [Deltaproteobacteria bacterium]|nr:phage tail sheath family protein [Deltaproteobacteria bacterium]
MPVTPTYPGLYIEELPSSACTITAAPTSIAVFVGYSHPFQTKKFGAAVRIFGFNEYEREFGGLFKSSRIDRQLAYAVHQFFLNGGSVAYVVGLQPKFYDGSGVNQQDYLAATVEIPTANLVLTAREPTDAVALTAKLSNIRTSNAVADLQLGYGSTGETLRGLDLSITDPTSDDHVVKKINKLSTLVTASVGSAGLGATFPTGTTEFALAFATTPDPSWTTFSANDYVQVFEQDSSLDKVDVFNLLVLPGVTDALVWANALAFCEKKRAFLIMDPPANSSADGAGLGLPLIENQIGSVPKSTNGAFYFPYLRSLDPLDGKELALPPSGFVAGIYARTDNNRGVWKAPAGLETVVNGTTGVVEEGRMTDMRHGVLNPKGINCLRGFSGIGTVVFGARTLVTENRSLQQWRYVPVRRMALFIEQTLLANLGWVVFEPNDEPLWTAIRTSIEGFMLSLFRQGAFQGGKPSEAFLVKCDSSTTTQDDIDNGKVNIVVGFRPLKPAEFVIIKISQLAGQAQS